jgi:hypothetical protein
MPHLRAADVEQPQPLEQVDGAAYALLRGQLLVRHRPFGPGANSVTGLAHRDITEQTVKRQ